MKQLALNYNLPKAIIAQRSNLGRRSRGRTIPSQSADTHKSVNALLQTQYGLSEDSYREYGVKHGILSSYLGDKDSFRLCTEGLYTDLQRCDAYNIASIVKTMPEALYNVLPEGPCGDVGKDVALLPEGQPLGIINRKIAVEIISQLKQYNANGSACISSRGILLDGKRGTGKSYILNHLGMWARNNGWMVILESSPSKYAKEIGSIKRSNAGSEFAVKFLETLLLANKEKLSMINVSLPLYGKVSLDGNHVTYSKRMFNGLIEKAIKEELEIFMEEGNTDALECEKERLKLWHSYRQQFKIPLLTDVLPGPKNLAQIAQFGVENETYANQAIYEIFNQLKHQTQFPLLIIVDEYNECFPVSEYLSIKYDNTKFNGWIPSYHLAMPRLFSMFDGHQYKRGMKVMATTWTRTKRRQYKPELLGIMPHEVRTVRNFTPKEYANHIHHLQQTQTLFNFPNDKTMYFYMLTG
ncbi:mitochondrial 28S ribosomal protein S29 like protein [Babesia gibsoni]|uniref:Small ribosomal subunit protein mS29 n=1 Tax=Babesia gibsoni TaxID=33632 RepID=A0AAD8LMA4_BABGI|nr:mitochondrial 28S ribosomal protein S29 like protein [Babesia gibsoni]